MKIILALPFKTEVEKLYIIVRTFLLENYTFKKFSKMLSHVLVTIILHEERLVI